MTKNKNPISKQSKRGPKPETLKIESDWRGAIKGALKKKRPAAGWPKPSK
jgi:hypothetical protein